MRSTHNLLKRKASEAEAAAKAAAEAAAETVPQAHEEGLEYGDNAADIAADNMAATFAAKTAHEEMQREVGGAGRGPAMRNNAGETADATSSSDDGFVKQAARQLLEQVLAYHTSKEKSQVLSDSRYRSILFSLLPQSGVEVPSQDLQEFPLSRNDQKNQISAKKPTAKKDATGYEYKGERYVVRSLKGEIMLPASLIFEVLFRMYKGGARTKERLHDMVKSSQYDQTSLPGIVIDDFMRVMRMCDQDLPPLEMKYSN